MNDFTSLGLSHNLLKVLPELGFETPTPIQSQTIPALLTQQTDLLGLAQTGTGKTGAFGLPLIDLIEPSAPYTQAVILAPTRELCQQINGQLLDFSKYIKGLNILAVFGGVSIQPQIVALKKPVHIIVATPGRLIDLLTRRKVDLSSLKYLILDEADEMLNMGFQEDIDTILKSASPEKRTWLFSATMPNEIRRIVQNYMTDPLEVKVSTGQEINKNIRHMLLNTRADDKLDMLKQILDTEPEMKGIIFTRTKANASDLTARLVREGYSVDALHGDLSQAQRDRVMQSFKQGRVNVILATDVAARGIDVDDLTHVIHYNLSDDVAFYTHRSGRTARAGKTGISLVFATSRDRRRIQEIESRLKIKFEHWQVPDIDQMYKNRLSDWASRVVHTDPDPGVMKLFKEAFGLLRDEPLEVLIPKILQAEIARMGYYEARKNEDQRKKDKKERKAENRKERRSGGDSRSDGDRNRNSRGDRRPEGDRRSNRDDRSGNRKSRRSDQFSEMDRSKGKSSRSSESTEEMNRFFINVGSMDGLSKPDLIDFVAEQGRVSKQDIGRITIHKSNAYFEVAKSKSKGLPSRFEGISVNNRRLRVNRDDVKSESPSPKKKKKK